MSKNPLGNLYSVASGLVFQNFFLKEMYFKFFEDILHLSVLSVWLLGCSQNTFHSTLDYFKVLVSAEVGIFITS